MYDPAIGRWHVVDPMAEAYESFSPYHMAGNNPILFLDVNGEDYYSTSDPDQIRAIWLALQTGGAGIEDHDFSSWEIHASDEDFTKVIQVVEYLLDNIGVKLEFKRAEDPAFIPGRCASVHSRGKRIGIIGEVHPRVLKNFKLEMPVAIAEIRLGF